MFRPQAELIDLAGPCGRFVAAAKRRSKAIEKKPMEKQHFVAIFNSYNWNVNYKIYGHFQ
jgi:hypothetical protein